MSLNIQELRDKKITALNRNREILNKARDEKRELTGEEQANFDKTVDEIVNISETISREEKMREMERDMLQNNQNHVSLEMGSDSDKSSRNKAQREAFLQCLRYGHNALTQAQNSALQVDSDQKGGYLTAPPQFYQDFIQEMDDEVFLRTLCHVIRTKNINGIGAPGLETDADDGDWTSEIGAISEDTSLAFNQRRLAAYPLTKLVKVSEDLLMSDGVNVEKIVRQRLAHKLAVPFEKGILTGTGDRQPLGVFTKSDAGISSDRWVSTDNTNTTVTFNGLKNAKYTLKQKFWKKALWVAHRDLVKMLAKIKDTNDGQYIWQPGVKEGEPDRLLGFKYRTSEFAPNTFTTGKPAAILGDFSYYWIHEFRGVYFKVLKELYAENSLTGFVGRMLADGMPVMQNAFVVVAFT